MYSPLMVASSNTVRSSSSKGFPTGPSYGPLASVNESEVWGAALWAIACGPKIAQDSQKASYPSHVTRSGAGDY